MNRKCCTNKEDIVDFEKAIIFTAEKEPGSLCHEQDKIKKVNDKTNKI